ncbi:phosphopantetheine-binding protein [Streptomyces sp. NPDC002644]
MTPVDHPLADTAPTAVVAELVRGLAHVLKVEPGSIDPGQPFRSLGVGSIPAVQFVSFVNHRYGTDLRITSLAEYPTPLILAGHVAREVGNRREDAPPAGEQRETDPGPGAREVLDVLRERLADILGCEAIAVDVTAPFALLGVDSIRAAKLVAVVNETYGLNERVVTLSEHPNLLETAAHVADAARKGRSPSADRAAEGVGALLDAVRDGRLSVDEAVTRLPQWV